MMRLEYLIDTLANHRKILIMLLMVQLCALMSSAQTCVCKCGKDTMPETHKCYVILGKNTLRGFCYCPYSQNVKSNFKIKAATKNLDFTQQNTLDSINWELVIQLFICFAAVVFVMWSFFNCRMLRQFVMKHLLAITLFVFGFGVVLYIIGFNWEGSEGKPVTLLLRSITASMEMFVSESELIEVNKYWKENPFYMVAFALTHFFAVCISAIFILHLIGIRAWSYIRMSWFFNFGRVKNQEVYVFFDLGNESMTLAKSIHSYKQNEKNHNCKIIFVRTPLTESHQERFSFSHILSFVDNKSSAIDDFLGMDALLCYSKKSLTLEDNDGHKDDLGLSHMQKYIQRRAKKGEIHFFCLSKDEDTNISTAINLRNLYNAKAKIYCHARKNNAYAYLEDEQDVMITDSSNLSILLLKDSGIDHPISLLDCNNQVDKTTATVSGKFTAMIIGMGETGKDAFRFLYEYSALPTIEKGELETKFYLVDASKSKIMSFMQEMPSIEKRECVECVGLHTDSIDFWNKIEELKNKLNCIYVTLGGNKENMKVISKLFDYLSEHMDNKKTQTPRVTIYMRVYEQENYNQIKYIVGKLNACNKEIEVKPFGAMTEIFTYETVVKRKIQKEANMFDFVYYKTYKKVDENIKNNKENKDEEFESVTDNAIKEYEKIESQGNTIIEDNSEEDNLKDANPKDNQGSEGEKTEPTIENIWNQRRTKKQNVENSLHKYTVVRLGDFANYENLSKDQKENLARCEHLRWVRSHELLGYCRDAGSIKLAQRKKHPDMVDWEKLGIYEEGEDEKVNYAIKHKRYDYNVIIVSYHLYKHYINMKRRNYTPKPIETEDVVLPNDLETLAEDLARNVHEVWSQTRLAQGWKYGEERSDSQKTHPCLIPYEELPEEEKVYDRNTAMETLKLIVKLGYKITKK